MVSPWLAFEPDDPIRTSELERSSRVTEPPGPPSAPRSADSIGPVPVPTWAGVRPDSTRTPWAADGAARIAARRLPSATASP